MILPALLRNIRFYILCFSILLSLTIFWYNSLFYSGTDLFIIRLTEEYGLAAITYLYISLLASPLTQAFSFFPLKSHYIHARRAIGVSAFYFALLHSIVGFFGPLGGIDGIGFLQSNFRWAIILGFIALINLSYMAFTSFDNVINKMGFNVWKTLHRTIYLGGILILIHVILIGSHFTDLSATIPQILFYALLFLLTLEAIRLDKYLYTKFLSNQSQKIIKQSSQFSYSNNPPHNSETLVPATNPTLPQLQVSLIPPARIEANQNVHLEFQLLNPVAQDNKPSSLESSYSSHLVIIDHELQSFTHLKPALAGSKLSSLVKFPHPGRYDTYLTLTSDKKNHQVFHHFLDVGPNAIVTRPVQFPDHLLSKHFGPYLVSLRGITPLNSTFQDNQVNLDVYIQLQKHPLPEQQLHQPAKTWGMLINQTTHQYIPLELVSKLLKPANHELVLGFIIPKQFWPPGKGNYRLFIQVRMEKLHTFDFTVRI